MNAATLLIWLRTFRPAIATVLILGLVAGLVQTVGQAPSASVAEPPAFAILPQGNDVARLDGRVDRDAPVDISDVVALAFGRRGARREDLPRR